MDKQEHLICFISRVVSDNRLKPVHISLSIALCHSWISNQFHLTYHVSRRLLMKSSRIRSKATYHKVLKELQQFGYVKYSPSYHPHQASEVMLLDGTSADIKHGGA
jgi:hypothetical protein